MFDSNISPRASSKAFSQPCDGGHEVPPGHVPACAFPAAAPGTSPSSKPHRGPVVTSIWSIALLYCLVGAHLSRRHAQHARTFPSPSAPSLMFFEATLETPITHLITLSTRHPTGTSTRTSIFLAAPFCHCNPKTRRDGKRQKNYGWRNRENSSVLTGVLYFSFVFSSSFFFQVYTFALFRHKNQTRAP